MNFKTYFQLTDKEEKEIYSNPKELEDDIISLIFNSTKETK